jgi:hypothetical protein
MTNTKGPAAYDTICNGGGSGLVRIEYIGESDAYVVSSYGDRWAIPVDMLELSRPGVRGGPPAEWAVSPAWTAAG